MDSFRKRRVFVTCMYIYIHRLNSTGSPQNHLLIVKPSGNLTTVIELSGNRLSSIKVDSHDLNITTTSR